MRIRQIVATALAAAGAFVLFASCTAPERSTGPGHAIVRGRSNVLFGGFVNVCKQGPPGTYNFTITAAGGYGGTLRFGSSFTLQPGECQTVWEELPNPVDDDPPVTVTVTEVNLPSGTQLDSVTAAATVPYASADNGMTFQMTSYSNATATFYNSLVPPPLPACPAGLFTYGYSAAGDLNHRPNTPRQQPTQLAAWRFRDIDPIRIRPQNTLL